MLKISIFVIFFISCIRNDNGFATSSPGSQWTLLGEINVDRTMKHKSNLRIKRQLGVLGIFGIICFLYVFTIFYSSPRLSLVEDLKPAYRLLEPNINYTMLAKMYPSIEPIHPNLVPDIVHYMQFLHSDVDFFFYLSVKSVVKYHKPALIMIHCDCNNLTGKYWDLLLLEDINIAIKRVNLVKEIGGRKIREDWLGQQNKDYQINSVFIEFGGFFIDQDIFFFNSYQQFRKYNFSVKVDSPSVFGCNLIMAARNLTFQKLLLQEWINDYHVDGWSWNCAVVSSQIANKYPSMYPFNLRSKPEFVDDFQCGGIGRLLFQSTKDLNEVLKFYSVHLCNFFLKKHFKTELEKMKSLEAIRDCDETFCKLARYILH